MLYFFVLNILLYVALCCLIFFPYRHSWLQTEMELINGTLESEGSDTLEDGSDCEEEEEEDLGEVDLEEEIELEEEVRQNVESENSAPPNIVWMAKKCLDLISSVDCIKLNNEEVIEYTNREHGNGKKSTSMFEELIKCLKGKTRSDFYSWDDILSDRRDSVKILLDRGFSVNGQDREGDSLLHYACRIQNVVVVTELLDKGSRISLNKRLESPLHSSVTVGNTEISQILLKAGAYVNVTDKSKNTPLHIAAKVGEEPLVQLLLEYKANVRAQNDSKEEPIHLAVKNAKIVSLLIAQKVDLNIQTKDGSSPLHCAAKYNCTESIELLLKSKALVNIKDVNGSTPLIVQCMNFSFFSEDNVKCFDCVKILLERGACSNSRNYCGQTPLHFATENELVDIMEMLLEYGADPNVISEVGDSPLHIAVRNQSLEVVYTLLEWGADINLEGLLGETPLDIAAQSLSMFNVWNYSSEVLVKHIAKLTTAGIYLQFNDAILTLYKKISSEFLRKCTEEVFRLSGKTILCSTSYLDVLICDQAKLTKYTRNTHLEDLFKQGDYLNEFVLYSSLLSHRFRTGFERNYLMMRCFKQFRKTDFNLSNLPFDCFEKICHYLSLSDLKNLTHASYWCDENMDGVCYICKGTMTIPKHKVSQPPGSKRFHLIKILNY